MSIVVATEDSPEVRCHLDFTMTTSDSPLASHPPPDPTVFATWLRSRGVVQHPSIEIKLATDGSGYGVWSTDDIARGEICTLPLLTSGFS
jgi:hypothetical protein